VRGKGRERERERGKGGYREIVGEIEREGEGGRQRLKRW